jgi:alpha-L-fucosidase
LKEKEHDINQVPSMIGPMKNLFQRGLPVWAMLLCVSAGRAESAGSKAAPSWPKADAAAVARWQALRFGMFVHWGPVSLTGHEIGWSRGAETPVEVYDNLYKEFNPTNFNADDWVSIARAAGMKYIVLTTKHHDGFCLWDTKLSDYNIMHTPFHRDVVKELAAACKKQDLAFGAYYSVTDWYDTNWPVTSPAGRVRRETSDLDAYEKYLQGQIAELIENYGPLITLWNDVPAMYGKRGADTIRLARSLQPDILINDRTGDGGDYDTPEQRIGGFQMDRPWESCMTVSAHNAWAWGGVNDGVKSTAACLGMLIRGAGGDGNILLNVGPRPDGVIDPAQANLLKDIGAWLAKNGGSIYGTRGGPWKPTPSIASTRKGSTVFLHILRSPDGRVELPALPAGIKSAALLDGGKVEFSQENGLLIVTVPKASLDEMDTIVRLELEGSAMDLPALTAAPGLKAAASNVFRNLEAEYGAEKAFDNDPTTRWATDSGTKQAWISAEFSRAKTITGIRIQEAPPYAGRVKKFEFQYRDGDAWKTLFTGQEIGGRFEKKFEAVTAREFRLNILEATEGPTIAEIEFMSN